VLLPMKVAQGVADGSVSLAFRRWRKQDVVPGQVFTTSAGLVRVDDVTVVDAEAITDDEAVRAGWPDADRLRRRLAPEGETYREQLSYAGPDPRIALRSSAELTPDDVAELDRRLERLDRAAAHGPWTRRYLELIRQHPQRRAPDLAERDRAGPGLLGAGGLRVVRRVVLDGQTTAVDAGHGGGADQAGSGRAQGQGRRDEERAHASEVTSTAGARVTNGVNYNRASSQRQSAGSHRRVVRLR
jgi:hypothetical protein